MRVITPVGRISFPNLFMPRANKAGKLKYECAILFEEGTDLSELKRAALAVAQEKYGEKAAEMIRKGTLRWPLRSGESSEHYPDDVTFLNVRSERKPGVVSVFPGPDGKPLPVTNPDDIYPGAFVRLSVTAFTYDMDGNRGVTFGLNNVQKVKDGERLDGGVTAADEFEADPNAIADLGALEGEDEQEEVKPARRGRKAAKAVVPDDSDPLDDLLG